MRPTSLLIGMCVCLAVASAEEPAAPRSNTSGLTITQTAAVASAIAPANSVRLAYKFRSGQFVHYAGANRIRYDSQLGKDRLGENIRYVTRQSNETESHFRVVTVDEAGLALIEPVVDRTRMVARMHDRPPVVFDSDSKVEPPPEFRAVRDAIGKPIARFQVAPNGKLIKALVIAQNAPASLREAAEKLEARFAFLPILPTAPVSVGDKWREEFSVMALNEGLKQPIPIRRIFELTGLADGIAIIKFKTLAMIPINDPELSKQLIQQTPTGSIEFDIERGLVHSYTSIINQTAINALGSETVLQVAGEATEKLVSIDGAAIATSLTESPTTSTP